MKRRFKNSIKNQIVFFFLILLIGVFFMGGYFYFYIRITTAKQAKQSFVQYSAEMEKQLEEKINVIDNVAKSCGYYSVVQKSLFSQYPSEKVKSISASRELISTYKTTYPYIKDIYFYIGAHNKLYTNTTYINEFTKNMQYYGLIDNPHIDHSFLSGIVNDESSLPYFFYYVPISNILDGTHISRKNDAVCAILCDITSLFQLPSENDNSFTIQALIYDDQIVSCSWNEDPELYKILLEKQDSSTITFQGKKYFYYISSPMDTWKYIRLAPVSSLINISDKNSQRNLYLTVIIFSLIAIVTLIVNINHFSTTLTHIVNDLGKLRTSSDGMRIKEPSIQELNLLVKQINEMLDKIENSTKEEQLTQERLFSATLAQQEAEMIAYRSQINPHFLFNTLECIRSMAQYYEAEPIEEIITSMSKLFRYSLYTPKNVTLTEEINHAEQYLKIITLRFSEDYYFIKHISEEAKSYTVPSMFLQPLIENCIKHGFMNGTRKAKCMISLKAYVDWDGFLNIVLTDNGCGMNKEQLRIVQDLFSYKEIEPDKEKNSIGVHNIYKRLRLSNINNSITIASKEGYYTQITIRIISYIAPDSSQTAS